MPEIICDAVFGFRPWPARTACAGNTLAEYGVIGVVVTVGCILMIYSMGTRMNGFMGNLKTELGQHAQIAVTATALKAQKAELAAQARQNAGAAVSIDAGANPQQVALQVAGANGTQIQANTDTLKALAEKYKQSNPDVYNLIMALGEKGMQISSALLQQLAEQVSKQVTSTVPVTTTTSTPYCGLLPCLGPTPPLPFGPTVQSTTTTSQQVTSTVTETVYKVNAAAVQAQKDAFQQMWQNEVLNSAQYKALTPTDQKLLTSLAQSNIQLANTAIQTQAAVPVETAQQVEGNSKGIQACGSASGCSPNSAPASSQGAGVADISVSVSP